ncbi:hypothetical protein NUH30_19015 [Leptospira sp. 85282-16]|uniref:hypothetical protein n=1 Tax=Leptospira sp. 85282-16 TaxID=2971256 RepID=UPI0021BE3470|nr:hypothetical protein [Leptospira sp. 85282-16]MCT8335785.1 hypothetical protein [Leptospira sp. 85282-16]
MFKILFVVIVNTSLLNVSISAQSDTRYIESENLKIKINNIEKRIDRLEKTDLKALNARLEFSKEIISGHDTMFSGINTIFALVSVILATLGIILPFLTYFLGIKPAQESIKNLKKEMSNFLKNSQKEQVENALENLKNPNLQLKNNANLYLSFNQHYDFSEKDYFEIYTLLQSDLEESYKSLLKMILSNKISKYATNFFDSLVISNEAEFNLYYIVRYYSICGIETKLNNLAAFLSNSATRSTSALNLASVILNESRSDFFKICESTEIISAFNETEGKLFLNQIIGFLEHYKITDKFSKTKLYKAFQ